MSYSAHRSHLPTPASSPTHERSLKGSLRDTLHDKYVFYAMRVHDSRIKMQQHLTSTEQEALYSVVKAEFCASSDCPTAESTPKTLSDPDVDDFWRKCNALCPKELGDDPRRWCQQFFASFFAMQFITSQKGEVPGLDINAWRNEIDVILASKRSESGNVPVNKPRPGVLGQARLLDWVGSSFIGKDGVEYYVQNGGTTVADGPFYTLLNPAKAVITVSANEFEKMVEGQDIPIPKVDDYID